MERKKSIMPQLILCFVMIAFSFGFAVNFVRYDLANKAIAICVFLSTVVVILRTAQQNSKKNQGEPSALITAILKVILLIIGSTIIYTGVAGMKKSPEYFGFSVTFIFFGVIMAALALAMLIFTVYEFFFYRGPRFKAIKADIQQYIDDCNALNEHVESLKDSSLLTGRKQYGKAVFTDTSSWNYKRKGLADYVEGPNVCQCELNVVKAARSAPIPYVCKMFRIEANEENLGRAEEILNNFSAVEEGEEKLQKEKNEIISNAKKKAPAAIRLFSKKLHEKLGFNPIDLSNTYFPQYIFQYISKGGNSSRRCDIIMDPDNLEALVSYLSDTIARKKSAAGQRALMTRKLREKIKARDNYTCKICGNSIEKEPNLLLEIDHVIPVSKGGLTTEDNLQTLCWRCNRSKGAKIS